ncbi:tape measure protein [Lysinibacillus capsici]|uniref:tape measure protein n=1 Tax=Lysinibacillus capsici TaxID=2115968 RepID=UPI002E1AFF71|nr:tape measure protein [Lysinibacillus capsici]
MANNSNNNEVSISFKAFNQEFNKAMSEMSKETTELRQQMKLQQEQMKHNASETEKLEAKMNGLQQIYDVTRQKTQATAQQLEHAKALWGENSEEAKKLETQLRRNQIAEQQAANALTETQQALERARQAQADQTDSLRQLQNLFTVTGQSVGDFSGLLGRDLTRAIQNGTASANQLDRAFDQIARSSLNAGRDLTELRASIRGLDSGSSVEEVRQDLARMGQEANNAEQEVNGLTDSLKSMAGAAVTAIGVGTAISTALDSASLDTSIKISLDVPDASKETVRQAIRDVEAYGVDGEAALEGVRRQWALNKDATDAANQEVVNASSVITRAYSGVDFTELIQETNEVAKALGISNIEATNLINRLLKIGFPPEQLDIISEYGVQLKRAGYNAQEIENILSRAAQEKSWNIDNLLDGLKEGRIRAVEMGNGLKESMKDAIRDVVGDTQKMSESQISAMEANFSKQEDALAKSLSNQEKALSKSHTQQQNALSKKLDAEYNAVSKNYDNQLRSLEKKLTAEYDAAVKNYDKQQKELEKSLAVEVREFEKASQEKIKIIDNEYKERMKLIDEEKYNQLKALDNQIDALNAKTEAEDKAIKERENTQKRAELSLRVSNAKTSEDRQNAIKELRDFEERISLEKIRENRKEQIDALKYQKETVKETSDARKEALKTEVDERKEQLKEQTSVEKEALQERHNAQKEAFQQRKQEDLKALSESNKAQIDGLREVNQAKLSALKEEQNNRKQALSERLNDEIDAVREAHQAELESFRAMNDEKLAIAKDPPDSAAVQSLFGQLEGWGKAIAKGGEEGSKAFSEMAQWLSQIEDATLREVIGTEIFGTMWEDQGDAIVSVLKDVAEGQVSVAEGQGTIQEMMDDLDTDPMTSLKQAVSDVKEALDPLLGIIANVVSSIANFAKENSVIASIIVAIVGIIGTLIGAFTALSPAILTITTLFGSGGAAGGFASILGKIIPIIMNLASKILPALRIAFGALSGPIGIAVTALTIAIPLIIKNWDSIKEFFVNLWNFIIDIFKKAVVAIADFLRENWQSIIAVITGPVGIIVKLIVDNWSMIKNKTVEIFTDISNFFSNIWSKISNIAKSVVDKIKGFFSFSDLIGTVKGKWDSIYSAIKTPIDNAKNAVKKAIDAIKGFFNFNFNWPKLKVPKFKIKGSINPLDWFGEGLPKIDIQWHAKGGVFNKPTLFNTASGMHGVGEAGPEAILPLNERVLGAIGKAIFDAAGGGRQEPQVIHNNYERMLEGAQFIIREEADVKKISREIYDLSKRDRKGK